MDFNTQENLQSINPGKVFLGMVEVSMGRLYMFGMPQKLHEMVSFIPGLGNGKYEVYGELKEVPGQGHRIVKIEIECITNEEILYYAKKESDSLLEHVY